MTHVQKMEPRGDLEFQAKLRLKSRINFSFNFTAAETKATIKLPHLTKLTYRVTLTAIARDEASRTEYRSAILNDNLRDLELLGEKLPTFLS